MPLESGTSNRTISSRSRSRRRAVRRSRALPSSSRLFSICMVGILLVALYSPGTVLVSTSASYGPRKQAAPGPLNRPSRVNLTSQNTAHGGKRSGELLVRFRKNATVQDQNSLLAAIGGGEFKPLRGKSEVNRLILNSNQTLEAVALVLQKNTLIASAEPNYLIYQDSSNDLLSSSSSLRPAIQMPGMPNDPSFPEQWALQNLGGSGLLFGSDIQVSRVWARTTGSQQLKVAVIDSGIDFTHPDLEKQRWSNAKEIANGKDDDNDLYVDDVNGWDFVTDSRIPMDDNGHGTNVAGIIAAEGNNNLGISGVLWKASLMNLRVLDAHGIGDIARAIEAIDYAVDHGALVINLSWGTDEKSLFLKDAIRRASRNGVVVVCSAGNDARDLDTTPYYPAGFDLPNLISVGASDGVDNPLATSNFGKSSPTIAAPGASILTTKAFPSGGTRVAEPNGAYELVFGTSAAAAMVTGIVGLFKSVSPTMNPTK